MRLCEIARVKRELTAFEIRYREAVGLLHEELDQLEQEIAQIERGELSKRAAGESSDRSAAGTDVSRQPAIRYTSDVVRRLFRDVAKAVHPDLARDDSARSRRHTIMAEANRAYALGDEERLRRILESWEKSPEAVQGSDAEATRLRLLRRIAQIDEELTLSTATLAAIQDSALWKLKAMVDEAAGRGRDLVSELAKRLTRDIMIARNRLDAIQSTP